MSTTDNRAGARARRNAGGLAIWQDNWDKDNNPICDVGQKQAVRTTAVTDIWIFSISWTKMKISIILETTQAFCKQQKCY
jgi:hypothetical protein